MLFHFSSNTTEVALTILQGLDDKPLTDEQADDFIKWMADLAKTSIENDDRMKEVSVYLIKMKNRTLWVRTDCFSNELWSTRAYQIGAKLDLPLHITEPLVRMILFLYYTRIVDKASSWLMSNLGYVSELKSGDDVISAKLSWEVTSWFLL